MTSRNGSLVRLLAGTSADERRPATSPGPEREWHLPAHVRDPKAVRERMIAQVTAGADVLLAHTFLTHRRALARVGEARRARELTLSAVVLARQAAERGRDGVDQATAWSSVPVLVAGALPLLGEDPGSGHLGPVESAIARDLHDHAGLLADAGVDIILVEGPRSPAETAVAIDAGRSAGIETWAVVGHDTLLDSLEELGGSEIILIALGDTASSRAALGTDRPAGVDAQWDGPHGALVDVLFGAADPGAALREVLAAGATVLGIADGATAERLATVRAAMEAHGLERSAAKETRDTTWLDWVRQGAARAGGGRGLWLSPTSPGDLPAGWDWTVLAPDRIRQVPAGHYRLVVSDAVDQPVEQVALRLDDDGVLVAVTGLSRPLPEPMRLLEVREVGSHQWLIARRR
ncbi:MAG: homocysteine S-methyltransferase family protein [Chloroflexota bacterium]|nr:homocysteine S-methyltransferase family protein [Chloroflexota bacterium]